jgi:hypothetical protein
MSLHTNNEKRTFSAETPSNGLICPVRAAMRMVFRARRLGHPDNLPLAVYKQKNSFAYVDIDLDDLSY